MLSETARKLFSVSGGFLVLPFPYPLLSPFVRTYVHPANIYSVPALSEPLGWAMGIRMTNKSKQGHCTPGARDQMLDK